MNNLQVLDRLIKNNITDIVDAYQQGRADEQLQSIEDAKKQATEYLDALDKAKREAYQQGRADGFQEALTSNGINIYVDKIEADGAREFLAWYSGGETMPSFGRYANYKIDDVIAEWQKGKENE